MSISRKIGLSSDINNLNTKKFAEFIKNDITAIEVSVNPEDYPGLNYKQISADAKATGIDLWSYHLQFDPFDYIDISSKNIILRRNSVELLGEQIRRAADIGIPIMVAHTGGEPIADNERDERLKYSAESLAELAKIAKASGARIAVEDLPRSCLGNCSKEILRLIDADPSLGVCYDSNHLFFEDGVEFLRAVKDRLLTVHISDFDFVNERHWLPGEGKIDWVCIMDTLDEIEYKGVFMYEMSLDSTITILRENPLTLADFRQNAKELEARAKLTTKGKIYPNLGMWGPEA